MIPEQLSFPIPSQVEVSQASCTAPSPSAVGAEGMAPSDSPQGNLEPNPPAPAPAPAAAPTTAPTEAPTKQPVTGPIVGGTLIGGIQKDRARELANQALQDLQAGTAFTFLKKALIDWNPADAAEALLYTEYSLSAIKAVCDQLRIKHTVHLSAQLKAERAARAEGAPKPSAEGKRGGKKKTVSQVASEGAPKPTTEGERGGKEKSASQVATDKEKGKRERKPVDGEHRKLLKLAQLFSIPGCESMDKAALKEALRSIK